MKTLDDIFDYAKYNLQKDVPVDELQNILEIIVTSIRGIIHEHYSCEEVFKLAILAHILKRKTKAFIAKQEIDSKQEIDRATNTLEKIDTLIDAIESSSVISEGKYENQPLSSLLLEMNTMKEKTLVFHLRTTF
ncbi:TPA: hypothetical protein DIC40_03270 [Patescibacteria group bacterium]|nr:hypothetical protein P148_SR1C00001G0399 [candidate division SR1 bacterium RAAC1_SR1_1]HCY20863.1 hypothetical protein [Candidatus Gracilibacteria bacterium]